MGIKQRVQANQVSTLIRNMRTQYSEIVCLDSAFAEAIAGVAWLPEASAFLECSQVDRNGNGEEMKCRKEESNDAQ
jgi:hypothetical protein